MGPFEFISELCTFDAAFVRGRWLLSARYRDKVRTWCAEHCKIIVVAAVLETLVLMVAELVAVVFLVRWLVGL